ncbi:MAG: oligosaccharide flippase family protein [Bacteroidia bacterium]
MKRTFVSNLILLMSLNLLIKPFWILGIDRGVQNTLGYETYGMYSNLFTFSLLLITFLDLGINNFTSSTIAKNKDNIQLYFAPLLIFKLAASVFYFALTLFLGKLYGYDNYRITLLALLGFNQILSYFYLFFRSVVGGLQLFKTDALLSVIDRILMIVLCSLMLWTGFLNLSIHSFIYAQTISYLIAVGVTFFVLKPHLNQIKFSFEKGFFLPVLKQMYPYAFLSLLMTLYTRMDNILLQKLIPNGDYHNGVYASAFRLLEAANMMAALVSMLLLPIFSKMIEKKEKLSPLVQLSSSIMIIPALVLSLTCFAFKDTIMPMLYPQSTQYAIETFGVVILCFFAFAVMYVFGTLLTANGNLNILNRLALVALVINAILNYYLIPIKLALGAAVAALVTQMFIAVTNTYFGIKVLKLKFEPSFYKDFFKTVFLAIFIVLSTKYIFENWIFAMIVNASLSLFFMIAFKLLEPKDAIKIFKERYAK